MTPAERDPSRYLRELQLEKAASLTPAEAADFLCLDPVAAFVLSDEELEAETWRFAAKVAAEAIDHEFGGQE